MELSEAKEFWKNRAECFRIEIKNNKGKTPKDMLEKEKLEHTAQSIDTVLEALDNSVSKEYYEMVTKDLSNIINDLKAKLDNSISKDEVRKIIEQKVERLIHSKSPIDFIDNDEWTLEELKKLLGE